MKQQRPLVFLLAAALVLAVLLLAPPTRWLVRLELFPGLVGGGAGPQGFVRDHPNDYLVQLAGPSPPPVAPGIFGEFHDTGQLQHARGLVPRFPDRPSLRANILRYAMQGEIHLRRPEEDLLSANPVPQTVAGNYPGGSQEQPPSAQALAAFDADAAVGERLDPDNAYFPLMRAVGLFAAGRDAAGRAAVLRAGAEHEWREYYQDEVEGRWRITEAVAGGQEGISRMAVAASLLFPHYQPLRAAARLSAAFAVQDELEGRPLEGLALRLALARCGDLMRARSTTIIGGLVGVAISAIARSRPGGAPALAGSGSIPAEQRSQERLDLYCDYVTHLGCPEAAREARAQAEAGAQMQRLISTDSAFGSPLADVARVGVSLIAGWVLAANVLLLLLLGGLAMGLGRLSPLRDRHAPPLAVSMGATLAVLLALGCLAAWQMQGAASFVDFLRSALPTGGDGPDGAPSAQAPLLLGLAFGAAFPLLLLLTSAIKARVRHLPLLVGLVEGFRDIAPPLACALALLFGVLSLWTVHQENTINARLSRSLHGEGQTLAALSGRAWPGPVR